MRILIVGSTGFLGTRLMNLLREDNEVFGAGRSPKNEILMDATNLGDIETVFKKIKPEIVIHTVALTSSVACEKDPKLAKELNYETTRNIAEACRKFGSKMFFISSSYLFDGDEGNYSEEDEPNSSLIYSKEKILAEKEVLNLENSVVIRVDILYGYNGPEEKNSFLDKILTESKIFVGNPDQIRSPVLLEDVADAIRILIEKNEKGIFHVVGDEKISTLELFKKIASLLDKNPSFEILNSEDLLVKPLKNSSLNNSKIKSLGMNFHPLSEGLEIIKN